MTSEVRQTVTDAVLGPGFRRATFAGPKRGTPVPWVRVGVRPLNLRGNRHLQFTYFDGRKTVTKNHRPADASPPLDELLAAGFAGIHLSTRAEEVDVRTTKKGKVVVGRRAADASDEPVPEHNRVKDVPLPEGRADRVLEVMGVLTATGRVRPTMRAKFTQINEFLKHLRHGLADAGLSAPGRELAILDCGCGSSYLTLAAHHYLNDVLKVPARLLGVDVNDEAIRKSMARAERLQEGGRGKAEGGEESSGPPSAFPLPPSSLSFACGKIGDLNAKADIVLALHACYTATDDALAQAVRSDAKLILCAPCCHRHLNAQIRPDGPAGVLRPVLRHGILRERTADLVTDSFRALALRVMGYKTEVVEFVSPDHTARNLLIRAVRGAPAGDPTFVAEYREMKRFWAATPAVEAALGEPFRQLVGGPA